MRRLRQATSLALVGVGTLLCWALGLTVWLGVERTRPVTLPAPIGPYAVGRAEYDWIDGDRADPSLGSGAKRELVVWIWYPANPIGGSPVASYLPAPWRSVRDHEIKAWLAHNPQAIHAHAVQAATIAVAPAPFPVLIFEPGLGNGPFEYTALLEELASHGYVVAGIFPTGSTDARFADGRVARPLDIARDPSTLDALLKEWVGDVRFVLDRLATLRAAASDPLAERIDLDRVGFVGHSFGGATAVEACRIDRRCRAAADLDGMLFGNVAHIGLSKPYLLVTRDNHRGGTCIADCVEEQDAEAARMRSAPGGHVGIEVRGFGHLNFADSAVTFTSFGRWEGVLGAIDGRRGLRIAAVYVEAVFDHALTGVETPLLDGPSPTYPEVRFIAR